MAPLRFKDMLELKADELEELQELAEYELLDTVEEMPYISMDIEDVPESDLIDF